MSEIHTVYTWHTMQLRVADDDDDDYYYYYNYYNCATGTGVYACWTVSGSAESTSGLHSHSNNSTQRQHVT